MTENEVDPETDNTEMDTQEAKAMPLRSDEPISTMEEDKLSRGPLVEVLADHILVTKAPDPVVIALNAPWGVGKSSFLKLLQRELESKQKQQSETSTPLVVWFNPWHYTNVEQLVRMFFGELAVGMGTDKKNKAAKESAKLLQTTALFVGALSPPTGAAMKVLAMFLHRKKSLTELKPELDKQLLNIGRRLVIFIDDIDRLEKPALRMLFQLVRLSAGFANTTYVLAFDRLVVEKCLDDENGIRGRDYLEKIIQVSLDIPTPEIGVLRDLLLSELSQVLAAVPSSKFDQGRWGNLFNSGFMKHFRTIRHIKRYVNGLRLTFPVVIEEVDAIDFLAVELIRVFHSELYHTLAKMKDVLAPIPSDGESGREISKDKLKAEVNGLCSKASGDFKDHVRGILVQIFPELERLDMNMSYGYDFYLKWRRDKRICANDVFDRYFLLAVPGEEISEVIIEDFVDGLSDEDATIQMLLRANEQGKARRILERLEDYTDDLSVDQAKGLLKALFDIGDDLFWESAGFADFGSYLQISRIVLRCLRKLDSEDQRASFLVELVQNGKALSTLIYETSSAQPRQDSDIPLERQIISDNDKWVPIRDAAVARIKAAVTDGSLWSSPNLLSTLFRWRDWTEEQEVRDAVSEFVEIDENLLTLVRSFIGVRHSFSMGDKVQQEHHFIRRSDVAAFLDVEKVENRMREIAKRDENNDTATEAANLLDLMAKGDEIGD